MSTATRRPSPPLTAEGAAFLTVEDAHEQAQIEALERWRAERDAQAVEEALAELGAAAKTDENLMAATLKAARAGASTGEWAAALRGAFGSYRAPTGVGEARAGAANGELAELREEVDRASAILGRRLKLLVGKPGLDGHSNGAEQIALYARDAGIEVVYEGIRLTAQEIAQSAIEEGVHIVGLSVLSGSHMALVPEVVGALRDAGVLVPVVVGGIVPAADVAELRAIGVAAVYGPKDYELGRIVHEMVGFALEGARS